MNIAFISLMGGFPFGGSEVLWTKAASLSLKRGYNVFVSVYNWGQLHPVVADLKKNGAIVHLRDRFNSQANIFSKTTNFLKNRIRFYNQGYNNLLKAKPEIVLINQGDTFDISTHHYFLYSLLKKHKISYALICHSHVQYSDIPETNIYPKAIEIFKNAKAVFFVSHKMKNITERKLCTKLPNSHITWNPLNLTSFEYQNYPKQEVVQFAIVGNLFGGKGHDTLFECLSQPIWRNRNWHLNIYGSGNNSGYLEDLAKFYELEGKITFHGQVKNINKVWATNEALLIPSAGEGLPISLVEANICGRIAIATDVGGIREIIEPNVNGFISEAPSVYSYSKTLDNAWLHKDKWKEMGEKAHLAIKNKVDFNPEKTLLEIITQEK